MSHNAFEGTELIRLFTRTSALPTQTQTCALTTTWRATRHTNTAHRKDGDSKAQARRSGRRFRTHGKAFPVSLAPKMDQVKVTDKTRLSDCHYENTISVLVGDKKQLFTVYKDVICASSKFFKAACSERWIEGKEKKISLPEVEPALFRSYVAWLYSGNYQLGVSKDDTVDAQDSALDTGVEL